MHGRYIQESMQCDRGKYAVEQFKEQLSAASGPKTLGATRLEKRDARGKEKQLALKRLWLSRPVTKGLVKTMKTGSTCNATLCDNVL